jgi:hypothetical protein
VLSSSTVAPRACAAAAIAGTSCTSKLSEPGDSRKTARVLSRMSAAIPVPTSGWKNVVSTPNRLRKRTAKVRVGP